MFAEQLIRRSICLTWILPQIKCHTDWGVVLQFEIFDFSRGKKIRRILTTPPTSFILLCESPTSTETKCCLLYFGNPKVFPLMYCFGVTKPKYASFHYGCLPQIIQSCCQLRDLYFQVNWVALQPPWKPEGVGT